MRRGRGNLVAGSIVVALAVFFAMGNIAQANHHGDIPSTGPIGDHCVKYQQGRTGTSPNDGSYPIGGATIDVTEWGGEKKNDYVDFTITGLNPGYVIWADIKTAGHVQPDFGPYLDGSHRIVDTFPQTISHVTFCAFVGIAAVDDPDGGDPYVTDEDNGLVVSEQDGVLRNDIFPEGAEPVVVLVDGPDPTTEGTLVLNSDGSFTFTPVENFNGQVSFTYYFTADGQTSNTATVMITVNPVNDPPEQKVTEIDASEDPAEPFQYPVDDLAFDVDGDPLTITGVDDPANGTASHDGDNVYYTPDSDFCGTDSLTFYVTDGIVTTPVTMTVNVDVGCVNDDPVADDESYDIDERDSTSPFPFETLTITDAQLLDGDTDVDVGDVLTVDSVQSTSAQGGSIADNLDGTYTYTPSGAFDWGTHGAFSYDDTFDYTVGDGNGGSDTGTVTVTVHRVVCSGETVTDEDENLTEGFTVSGSFTLLSEGDICKRYSVVADADDDGNSETEPDPSITFDSDETHGGDVEAFRGVMVFEPQPTMDGSFLVGLTYQPDLDDPSSERNLLACIAPVFSGGLVVSAILPETPEETDPEGTTETWCLAAGSFVANADGEYVPTVQVYGEQDPRFGFR